MINLDSNPSKEVLIDLINRIFSLDYLTLFIQFSASMTCLNMLDYDDEEPLLHIDANEAKFC